MIVAIHPVKPPNLENRTMQMSSLYDISNSAHCFNKADVGILIHRLGPTRSIIRLSKPVLVAAQQRQLAISIPDFRKHGYSGELSLGAGQLIWGGLIVQPVRQIPPSQI